MRAKLREEDRTWTGSPKLEKVMGIDRGMIALRSGNVRLLNRLVSRAIEKNFRQDKRTFYLYSSPTFLDAETEFISKISQDLGMEEELLMKGVHFINFSGNSPMELSEAWQRLEDSAGDTRLVIVDSLGGDRAKDNFLLEKVNRLCYEEDALALVLDGSDDLNPYLENLSAVVVDLSTREIGTGAQMSKGVEVFLRKHPRLPETVFLMSP